MKDDPFEALANEQEQAEAQMTGRAPPEIMAVKDSVLTRWNVLREGEDAAVYILDYDPEEQEERESLVHVRELIAFAHQNRISFQLFLKRRRWH